ncbi:MAG: ribose-5-phosphate isomerase RpiA [candidate division KSB1 bacterium]|nr:ribose-5-phosphate isomerase RpiA [candidate division KSB1 bacterium]MDQ7064014.1 ribose-5-phosphate isomerase RpiA [candidate division KSB1 bacterium]
MQTLSLEEQKRRAAEAAVEYIEEGMVLGLGTGSTVDHALQVIADKVRQGMQLRGVPTSKRTEARARELGIPLVEQPETVTRIHLTIDGADEADEQCNLIKGGGGALTREKIIASMSERVIIIVDSTKLKPALGSFPVPVEVLQFGWKAAAEAVQQLGATRVDLRMDGDRPFVTDNGHWILDCQFETFPDVGRMAQVFNTIPAVVENGIFYELCDLLIVAEQDGHIREIFAGVESS